MYTRAFPRDFPWKLSTAPTCNRTELCDLLLSYLCGVCSSRGAICCCNCCPTTLPCSLRRPCQAVGIHHRLRLVARVAARTITSATAASSATTESNTRVASWRAASRAMAVCCAHAARLGGDRIASSCGRPMRGEKRTGDRDGISIRHLEDSMYTCLY